MTFDIGLHEMCVRVGVRYVITKFSWMDSLPNFLTHGAPLRARFARARAPLITTQTSLSNFVVWIFFSCSCIYGVKMNVRGKFRE